jgi:dihydrofolate reductase
MRTIVYLGISLDGFIARPDGGLDWLEHDACGDDYGFAAYLESIDALVMGRTTFEMLLSFGVDWPYGDRPMLVLSRTAGPTLVPEELRDRVVVHAGPPEVALALLAEQGADRVYVDGGALVRSFLAEGLIDELTLSRLPIVIGEGVAPFGPLPHDVRLRHVSTQAFASGVVQSRYEVIRS